MSAKQAEYRRLVAKYGVEGAARRWSTAHQANPRNGRKARRSKAKRSKAPKKAWKWTPKRRAAFRKMRAAARRKAGRSGGRRPKVTVRTRRARGGRRRVSVSVQANPKLRRSHGRRRKVRVSVTANRRRGHRRNPAGGARVRLMSIIKVTKGDVKAVVSGGWRRAAKNVLLGFLPGLGGSSLIAYAAELKIREKGWLREEWQVDVARNGVRFVSGTAISAGLGWAFRDHSLAKSSQVGVYAGIITDVIFTGVKYATRKVRRVSGIDGVMTLAPSPRNVALHGFGLGQIAGAYEEYKLLGPLTQGKELATMRHAQTGQAAIVVAETGEVLFQGAQQEVDGIMDGLDGYSVEGASPDGMNSGPEANYTGDEGLEGIGEDITVES